MKSAMATEKYARVGLMHLQDNLLQKVNYSYSSLARIVAITVATALVLTNTRRWIKPYQVQVMDFEAPVPIHT
jgi:hypothetical protein